jgi:hypothetical protein
VPDHLVAFSVVGDPWDVDEHGVSLKQRKSINKIGIFLTIPLVLFQKKVV